MAEATELSLYDLDELFDDDCFFENCTSSSSTSRPSTSSSRPTTLPVSLDNVNSKSQQNKIPVVILKDNETVEIIKTIKSTNLTYAEIEIDDVKVLNDLIQQLSCCFQRKSFPNSSAKASWSSFHGVITNTILKFDSVLPKSFLTLFSIKYFEKLISKNVYETQSENSIKVLSLNSDEKDIVYYIGGSIIKKLINLKKSVYINEIADYLKADSSNLSLPHSELAHLVDRGGLTYLTNKAAAFFIGLEICFRCMYPLTKIDNNISKINYRLKCLNNLLIKKDFYEAVSQDKTFIDKEIEEVMTLCIDKYFIVRAHHKCRRMIESYRSLSLAKKRKIKGTKSLRKNLKVCVGQIN